MIYLQRPWYNDPRSKHYSHDALFGTISQFPATLGRPIRPMEHQKNSTRCTGYGAAVNGGYIYGQRFHPDWQASKIGQIAGVSVDTGGSDPNSCMKSQRDYGYCPYESIPTALSLERNTIENTGMEVFGTSYDTAAEPYKGVGFVKVDGPLDLYGDIKSALLLAYDPVGKQGACVQAFGRWYYEWSNSPQGIVRNDYTAFAGYHHWLFVDWKTINGVEYLVAHNSYGYEQGDGGLYYFPRDIVNREFTLQNTSLKIMKILTEEQKAMIAKETPIGQIWRVVAKIWYILSTLQYGRTH